MKNKKGLLIFGVLGVLLIAIGTTILLLTPKKSNKQLYTDAIGKSFGLVIGSDNITNTAETKIKEVKKELSDKLYKMTFSGSFTEGEAGFTNLDGTIYAGKDQFYLKTSIDQNDTLYDIESVLKDNKYYIYVKDVLDKYYYIENLSDLVQESGDTELVNKVIDYLVEAFTETIEEEKVNVENTDITINGKSYSTKKYGYTFSGDTLYEIITKFANKVRNDKDILTEFNKVIKESGSEYGEELSQADFSQVIDYLLEYAKEVKNLGNIATYNVYMYDDEPISRQLTINMPQENGTIPFTIGDYKVVESGKAYYKLAASAMGMELFKLEVKQTSDTEYTISVSSMNQEILTGKITKNASGIEITLNSVDDLNPISADIKIGKDGTGSILFKSSDSKLEFNYTLEEIDEIPEVDLSNSVPYSEMSEEEQEKLKDFMKMFVPTNEVYLVDDAELLEPEPIA